MANDINQLISLYVQRTGENPEEVAKKIHDIAETIGYGHNGSIFDYGDFISEEDFSSYLMSLSDDISTEDARLLYDVLDADGENGLSSDEMSIVKNASSSRSNYEVDRFSFWNLLLPSRANDVAKELEKAQAELEKTQSAMDGTENEDIAESATTGAGKSSSTQKPENTLSIAEIESQGYTIDGNLIKNGDTVVGEIRTETEVASDGVEDTVTYGVIFNTSEYNDSWKETSDGKILDEDNRILKHVPKDSRLGEEGTDYRIDGDKVVNSDGVTIGRISKKENDKGETIVSFFLYENILPDNLKEENGIITDTDTGKELEVFNEDKIKGLEENGQIEIVDNKIYKDSEVVGFVNETNYANGPKTDYYIYSDVKLNDSDTKAHEVTQDYLDEMNYHTGDTNNGEKAGFIYNASGDIVGEKTLKEIKNSDNEAPDYTNVYTLYEDSSYQDGWKKKPDGKILDENNRILNKVKIEDLGNGYSIEDGKIYSGDNPPVEIGRVVEGDYTSYFLYDYPIPDGLTETNGIITDSEGNELKKTA